MDAERCESAATRELTAAVRRIWCEVLGADAVDPRASLFQLGGHSLLATQVIARTAQESLGRLTVRALFDSPTIGRLAAFLQSTPSDTASAAPEIGRIPRLARNVKF